MSKRLCKTPIGIFDSGVGGLSILKELERLMPNEHYIYYGDYKNLPYGTKTPAEIIKFGREIINFFIFKGVEHIVMACNTSSAVSYDVLKKEFPNIKIYPLIQSVAPQLARFNSLAVLATEATCQAQKYTSEIKKKNKNAQVTEIPCDGFVEIVENSLYDLPSTIELVDCRLEELPYADRIVLGCTHYPYLLDILTKFIDKDKFINPAKIFANVICEDIKAENAGNIFEFGKKEFFTSADCEKFKENAKVFYEIKEEVNLA